MRAISIAIITAVVTGTVRNAGLKLSIK